MRQPRKLFLERQKNYFIAIHKTEISIIYFLSYDYFIFQSFTIATLATYQSEAKLCSRNLCANSDVG